MRKVTFFPTRSWNLIESFSDNRSRSKWKSWEIASVPEKPRSIKASLPSGVDIAIRRFVWVYDIFRSSAYPCGDCVSRICDACTGLEPAHPAETRRVGTGVIEPAIRNVAGAQ